MAQFKARARTVEMLGHQQIANVSTAFSELFKNAYDAYADNVTVDLFAEDNFLVIKDNGIGMTKRDFEKRWLTLGTEYKHNENNSYDSRPKGKKMRATMGEKGIGRLAIALLGNQVLILTRSEKDNCELVMCFIHWRLFELIGINLEEIEIPIEVLPKGKSPTEDDVNDICRKLIDSLDNISSETNAITLSEIKQEIESFNFDPKSYEAFFNNRLDDNLSLEDDCFGTHFYIFPANEEISEEIHNENKDGNITKEFSKFLLGFTNNTFFNPPEPLICTNFRHWKNDNNYDDLIANKEFFTKEELESADHRISGTVNEFGKFIGNVNVYDNLNEGYEIPWENNIKKTKCGPFSLEFGYIAGRASQSKLSPDDWQRMTSKLNLIGGIYVYRDNIRILPYGNSDVDWLKIEERRTYRASTYFFSHRRIFGAVILSKENNRNLIEKSGREGFRQDTAYRQLKQILENILIVLAREFFSKGDQSDYYWTRREQLNHAEKVRKLSEKRGNVIRSKVRDSIAEKINYIDSGNLDILIDKLKTNTYNNIVAAKNITDPENAISYLLDQERNFIRSLSKLRTDLYLSVPRGVGYSQDIKDSIYEYKLQLENLNKSLFKKSTNEISEVIQNISSELKLDDLIKKRLFNTLNIDTESYKNVIKEDIVNIKNNIYVSTNSVISKLNDFENEMENELESLFKDLTDSLSNTINTNSISNYKGVLKKYDEEINHIIFKNYNTIVYFRDLFEKLISFLNSDQNITDLEIVEAMDEELLTLREQIEADGELVQMGLTIAIINHEFETSINDVRSSIKELKPWTKTNPNLKILYDKIENNFIHLDQYLSLFTPLQKRLYSKKIYISGSDIQNYISALFSSRFIRHSINVKFTNEFLETSIESYPSTLFPVFVNVIDNAIYWLKSRKENREIIFSSNERYFLISNNGPKIAKQHYDAIFYQGFTKKPRGRGLGLFISKSILNSEGLDITIQNKKNEENNNFGVTFMVGIGDSDDKQ